MARKPRVDLGGYTYHMKEKGTDLFSKRKPGSMKWGQGKFTLTLQKWSQINFQD